MCACAPVCVYVFVSKFDTTPNFIGAELTEALDDIRNDVTAEQIDIHDYDVFVTMDDGERSDPVDPRVRDGIRLSDTSSFIFTSGTTGTTS